MEGTMRKSKSLLFSLLALVVAIVLTIVLFVRKDEIWLSPYEFTQKLTELQPKMLLLENDVASFTDRHKIYKVARDALEPASIDSKIILQVKDTQDSWLSDIGLFVVFFLGLAVILKALSTLFVPQKKQETKHKQFDLSTSSLIENTQKQLQTDNNEFLQSTFSSVTFRDVAGINEVKEELLEIIDYLKNPKKYQDLGIRLPKGVLLVGPPGVGKTMIAKAVAGEAGVPFLYQSGSSFVQIYVGMGAKRVRELFLRAKAKSPSIIFIDEIDAVGKARGSARNDEREATLNQLLTEMDGFEDSSGVIVIAATNKIDVLDEALLRPARFDRRIYVELPSLEEREKIFEVYLRDKKYDFDINEIARLCVGFSGAAIAALVNEAALCALRRKSALIQHEDILSTKDKVLLGKKKILSFSEEEKNIMAIYQSAKALSAYWLDIDFDKISLVTESFKEIDKELVSKEEMSNKIKMYLSGSVAVEMIYNQSFSNAKEDISKAKLIATQMCEEYGMAKRLLTDSSDVIEILEQCKKNMQEFLSDSKAVVLRLSEKLLKFERLSKDEIKAILDENYTF